MIRKPEVESAYYGKKKEEAGKASMRGSELGS
jgi:hypothetical protein